VSHARAELELNGYETHIRPSLRHRQYFLLARITLPEFHLELTVDLYCKKRVIATAWRKLRDAARSREEVWIDLDASQGWKS
jgi:hypothetical protein